MIFSTNFSADFFYLSLSVEYVVKVPNSISRYKFSCKVLYLLESLYLRIYSALLRYITWKDEGRRFVFFSFPLSSYFYWVPYFESGPEKGGVFLLVLRLVFSHSVHTKFFFFSFITLLSTYKNTFLFLFFISKILSENVKKYFYQPFKIVPILYKYE